MQANGDGTSHDPGDTFTITGNVTLYAQWTAVAPVAIPTLSQWGLIVMTGLMLITFVIMHRRRQGLV